MNPLPRSSDRIRPELAASFPPTPHGIPAVWIRAAWFLVLASLILKHGFRIPSEAAGWLSGVEAGLALVVGGDLVLALFPVRRWRRAFESRRVEYGLLAGFLGLLLLDWALAPFTRRALARFLHLDSPAALSSNLTELFLLFSLCVQALRGTQRLFGRGVRPELVLAGSFATLIAVGALLLLLPNSAAKADMPIGVVDSVFTSTSAVCVTGLVVRDTGTAFSSFGQTIILALIQTGGLGIITFVAFLSIFSSRTLPVRQMVAFQQVINVPRLTDLRRQIVGILLAAGLIELIGVVLVYRFLPGDGDSFERIRWSVFHTVSAFCNAGFALQHDSLEPFRANAGLMFTFMALIVLGGLGFLVMPELLAHRLTRNPFFRRIGFFRRLHAGQASTRLSVFTRLALTVTLILLATGFVGVWLLEQNHLLRDRPIGERLLVAAFQSVTTRTAGFNTVPIHELQPATLIFFMMLMVVGASPVSTGGGIKTVNFGILLLALRSMVMQRERLEVFGRTIPAKTLFAALSVFVLYVISLGLGAFLLAWFDPQMDLRDQVFEVISALSTVGLSTGITADLSAPSKLVLCAAMFIGRVGPIALVLSVFQGRRVPDYEFPEEEVVVG